MYEHICKRNQYLASSPTYVLNTIEISMWQEYYWFV